MKKDIIGKNSHFLQSVIYIYENGVRLNWKT